MELGDHNTAERAQRSRLDIVLDKCDKVFAELLDTVETGALDQLDNAEKVAVWQRFETF
jgi:hypothetical protein